jgi:hypothetical protein
VLLLLSEGSDLSLGEPPIDGSVGLTSIAEFSISGQAVRELTNGRAHTANCCSLRGSRRTPRHTFSNDEHSESVAEGDHADLVGPPPTVSAETVGRVYADLWSEPSPGDDERSASSTVMGAVRPRRGAADCAETAARPPFR